MSVIEVSDLNEMAVLRAKRIPVSEIESEGGHIRVMFTDPDGSATDLLRQHRAGALQMPTLDLCDAQHGARDMVFSARRAAGLDPRR